MGWPDFNFVKHASEVVCVAIGANLLLPVVPIVLRGLMSNIETDPQKIAKTKFKGLIDYINEDDLKHVGKVAKSVQEKIDECECGQGLKWKIIELIFAGIGVFLLWSNWIDDKVIAALSPVLLLPPVIVIAVAGSCYNKAKKQFDDEINKTILNAKQAKKKSEEDKEINDDEFVSDYVDKIKKAAKPISSAHPPTMPPAHG